jgi:hypothetical protein
MRHRESHIEMKYRSRLTPPYPETQAATSRVSWALVGGASNSRPARLRRTACFVRLLWAER